MLSNRRRRMLDRDHDTLAHAELAFRARWAEELGLDPLRADLFALEGLPPCTDLAMEPAA